MKRFLHSVVGVLTVLFALFFTCASALALLECFGMTDVIPFASIFEPYVLNFFKHDVLFSNMLYWALLVLVLPTLLLFIFGFMLFSKKNAKRVVASVFVILVSLAIGAGIYLAPDVVTVENYEMISYVIALAIPSAIAILSLVSLFVKNKKREVSTENVNEQEVEKQELKQEVEEEPIVQESVVQDEPQPEASQIEVVEQPVEEQSVQDVSVAVQVQEQDLIQPEQEIEQVEQLVQEQIVEEQPEQNVEIVVQNEVQTVSEQAKDETVEQEVVKRQDLRKNKRDVVEHKRAYEQDENIEFVRDELVKPQMSISQIVDNTYGKPKVDSDDKLQYLDNKVLAKLDQAKRLFEMGAITEKEYTKLIVLLLNE